MYKRKFEDDSNKENVPYTEKKIRQNDDEKNVCIVLSDNEEEDDEDEEEKEVSNESIIDLFDKSDCQSESESESESENETNPLTEFKSVKKFLKELDSNEEMLSYQVLEKILKNTKQIGDYCVSGEATNLPSVLGLEIEGFGTLSLPLVESVATSLIKLCSQAPYGHNFDTLVDKKVRDSYQLEPSKIKINNKNWPQKLNELVNKICADLGVKGNVEAKLYKMLIYEKGGHFLKHRDTEKENGMFATLVLQLPSIHEGGELVVYNGNNKKVYDFGQSTGNTPYLIHYAAHYADLEHELLEVKSGYRTALVYSLCWKNGNGFCPNIKTDLDTQVSGYLNTLSKSNKRLAICLEHQYTPKSLKKHGLTALKGIDNDRFNFLKHANEQLPFNEQFSFYIAHVNLIIESYDVSGFEPDYRYGYGCTDEVYERYCEWEENERTRNIKCWYDSKGVKVFDSVRVDVNFFHKIISPGVKDLDLNDTQYWEVENNDIEGYTGNEGINKTTTYGKYLLAMWPKNGEFHVLLSMDVNSAIDSLVNHMPKQIDSMFIEKLNLTFNCLEENLNYLQTKSILNLMKILETHNDLDKCKYLIEKCIKKKFMDLNFVKPICNLVKKYEWSNLSDSLKVLLEQSVSSSKENYFYSIHRTTSYNPIQINCNLAKTLFDEVSASLASKFYNEFVIPLFLNKLNPIPSSNDLILLIQTVNLFPSEQEIQLNKIKNALMTIKDKKVLSNCLKELIKSFSVDCLKIFKEVFEDHMKSLNLNIKNQREFSWQMPLASMPDHPKVEMFLKSNQESMIYANVFNSIGHARNFANKHSSETFSYSNPGPKMYSVRMEADGRGSNAFVRITKTKDFFKNEMNELAKYKQDVKVFSDLLSKFN